MLLRFLVSGSAAGTDEPETCLQWTDRSVSNSNSRQRIPHTLVMAARYHTCSTAPGPVLVLTSSPAPEWHL